MRRISPSPPRPCCRSRCLPPTRTSSCSKAPRSSPTPGSPTHRSTRASAARAATFRRRSRGGILLPARRVSRSPFTIPTRQPEAAGGTGSSSTFRRTRGRCRPAPAAAGSTKLPKGAVQSITDFGTPGYGGPCPPRGDRPHRYIFTVHALKVDKLDLDDKAMPALVGFMLTSNRLARPCSPRPTAASRPPPP